MKPGNCRWCGKEFEPQQTAQKYCPECRADPDITRGRARERKRRQQLKRNHPLPLCFFKKPVKTCLICGVPFIPASNRQKWCKAHRKQGRQEARTRYMRKYRQRKKESLSTQV